MDSARWEQIQSLFHEAVDLPESERQAFIDRACGTDADLHAELLRMLQADQGAAPLLDRGLSGLAYRTVGASGEAGLPREFGPYRLEKMLGEGGMGVVWLARREDAGNLVAVKFLPHAGLSPGRRDRFAREVKTLARLNHPYIARLYDAGALSDGTPWFAMEYVEGVHFTEYARTVSVEERLRLFRKICEAVQFAHGREIIHRDLKPSNILVDTGGGPHLLDFGIARELQSPDEASALTRAGVRLHSPEYAAPEWIQDGTVSLSTDVYSLGVILYESVAGRLPARSAAGEVTRKPSEGVRRSGFSRMAWNDLDVLCLKAMHLDPGKRYQSVEALARDVDHWLKGEPLEARPDSLPYRARKLVTRHRAAAAASAAAVVLVAILVTIFSVRLARERERLDREAAIVSSMNHFLTDDLLARTDPFRSGKSQESFVEVVNRASSQIDSEFRGEPLVSARLHGTIAQEFDSRSDYPAARREYALAADHFRKAQGALSQDAIAADLGRAAMEARSYEGGSLALAHSLLKNAEGAIARIGKVRDDVQVDLESTRGIVALIDNDPHSANRHFQAALKGAQAARSFDPRALRRIKRTVAFSYIRMGEGARAESLFRDLVAELARAGGADSPDTLQARINLSQSLFIQHKFAAAIQETDQIYPLLVQKLGEDHEAAMTVLGTRAASEGSLGMWDEAIRDDLTIYRLARRKQGPVSFFSLGMLSDAALSQCRAGRYAEGGANAREAFEGARKAFGPRAGITGGCSYALAVCLIGTNKLDQASELLRNIDAASVRQMTGDTTVDASIALAEGEIAARRQDYASAKRYAEAASTVFSRPDADVGEQHSLRELMAAIDAGQTRAGKK